MGINERAEADTYYRHMRNARILRKIALWCAAATAILVFTSWLSGDYGIRMWSGLTIMAGVLFGGASFAQWFSRHGYRTEPDPYEHPM